MRFKMVTDDHFVPHYQIFEEGNYQPLIFTFISKIQDFIFTIKKKKFTYLQRFRTQDSNLSSR